MFVPWWLRGGGGVMSGASLSPIHASPPFVDPVCEDRQVRSHLPEVGIEPHELLYERALEWVGQLFLGHPSRYVRRLRYRVAVHPNSVDNDLLGISSEIGGGLGAGQRAFKKPLYSRRFFG